MANEPQYRDLAKLIPYIPPFNDDVVVRIDRVSMTSAAIVGLFGILYFSLAPAATSTLIEVSSVRISGYNCKMISAVTRQIDAFHVISDKIFDDFDAEVVAASKSLKVTAQSGSIYGLLGKSVLNYENAMFETYEACLATAKADTTCKWLPSSYKLSSSPGPVYPSCLTNILCSSFNGKIWYYLAGNGGAILQVNQTLLADPAYGKCNNQANVSACSNINENCQGLGQFLATFEDKIRKIVLTPEVICKPYLDYPPYICSKSQALNVPSILSQSLAFATSALAAVKAISFMVVKMLSQRKIQDDVQNDMESAPPNVKSSSNAQVHPESSAMPSYSSSNAQVQPESSTLP